MVTTRGASRRRRPYGRDDRETSRTRGVHSDSEIRAPITTWIVDDTERDQDRTTPDRDRDNDGYIDEDRPRRHMEVLRRVRRNGDEYAVTGK